MLQSVTTGEYVADAVNSNGTQFANRASALSGVSNGKQGLISAWVEINTNTVHHRYVISSGTSGGANVGLLFSHQYASDTFVLNAYNSVNTIVLNVENDTVFTDVTNPGIHHHLISWDLSVAGSFKWYVDDVLATVTETTFSNDDINYETASGWNVLNDPGFSGAYAPWSGDVFDIWFDPGEYIDLTVEANRRNFIDASGKPVNPGAKGEAFTGTQPPMFFHLNDGETPANNFFNNAGSGGTFTANGTLTVAPSSPTD
tara:strand:- start:17200 stop:17973 length:774 start_codon:yes stop_codon:yes gene_type:complete